MFPHTVPGFKVPATLFTVNISILQVFCLNMSSYVSLSLHHPTSHTSPEATTLVHHLGLSQHVQGMTCAGQMSNKIRWSKSKDIYWRILQDLLVWLYRLFLELNSLLQLGQEYTKWLGKWIASIWFFTQVVVLFENLKHIPQVGMFSSFLIKNCSKSPGSLISPEQGNC